MVQSKAQRPHGLGKGPFAGEQAFPLQVAVHHNDGGGVIVQTVCIRQALGQGLFHFIGKLPVRKRSISAKKRSRSAKSI